MIDCARACTRARVWICWVVLCIRLDTSIKAAISAWLGVFALLYIFHSLLGDSYCMCLIDVQICIQLLFTDRN